MRFIILRKADRDTEAGAMPDEELIAAMGRYNEDLVNRGLLLGGDGLRPSREGARITFSRGKITVSDGPFAETKELLAGFTVIQADSLAEAVAIAKRWPPVDGGGNVHLEVRRLYELCDFGESASLDLHADLRKRRERQPALLNPYVLFRGDCREAFEFYADCLGGRIEMMLTHGESPAAKDTAPGWRDKILHAQLRLGSWTLMGSDAPPEHYSTPQGFSVQVSLPDARQGEITFKRLAEGGTIRMPFEKTFWVERFGMLVDRFGIPWMLNCGRPA
ncbi:MAG TPA: YciI family protein [Candidatus Krumholzibacteria bacterium]|nr:YciI family protein [Candidatus Krumholzibacteria bacterium]HPD73260.1 YciI family protein [Candidatus Krumholzibacteria bacterium]HRY40222.1 YciI family protein [Candidatus Krumholzibacteria bacterium]